MQEIRKDGEGDTCEHLDVDGLIYQSRVVASYIAQSVMISSLCRARLSTNQLLTATGALPLEGATAFTIATDDDMAYERTNGAEAQPSSICPEFQRLEHVWDEVGIEGKREKAMDRSLNGTCLGLAIVEGTCLMPKQSRLFDLVCSLITLLIKRVIADLLHFLGVLQFVILVNGP